MKPLLALPLLVAATAAFLLVPSALSQQDGTRITVTSGTWVCNQPLSEYGPLPVTVETRIPNEPADNANGDVRLLAGCTGDGDRETTDLILEINGDGGNLGSASDGLVLIGAHDIEIEGHVDCGAPGGGAHQDGIQMNSGYRLTFRGFDSGDWEEQRATCHGAGGIFYVSELNNDPERLVDVVCEGCRMVGSTEGPSRFGTALSIYGSTRSGARDSCFAANIPLGGPRADAVSPVQSGNLFIDLNAAAPQPAASECKIGEPPPTTTAPPTTTEPPPTTTVEEPPPGCDPECVAEYERRISELQEALLLALAREETAVAELEREVDRKRNCRAKLQKINRHFHDGKSREKMHRPVHWQRCGGFQ